MIVRPLRSRLRCRDDSGNAIVEFVGLGVLLLVPLVYALVSITDVQSAAYGASTASRAAGRAFVLAPDATVGEQRALAAARTALADQGVPEGVASVNLRCAPDESSCLTPGSSITVVVTVRQRLPLAPDFLGDAAPVVTVDAQHTETYGEYREARS